MERLKLLRKQHHLSQQKLADILLVSQQSVYKYENDITSPDIETLIRMADYFNTSIDYLIGHTDISHKIEPVTDEMLNSDETQLIRNYRKLSAYHKKIVKLVIDGYNYNVVSDWDIDC